MQIEVGEVEDEGSRVMKVVTKNSEQLFEELAYRENDGIEVSLLWNRASDSVTVFVSDTKSGDTFELAVGTDSPLEVFNHPYAYAAARGLQFEPAMPVG